MEFTARDVIELLDMYEFDLYVSPTGMSVVDRQGANLGDIESDEFMNFGALMDRFDTYHYDYIIRSIEEALDLDLDWNNPEEFIKAAKEWNATHDAIDWVDSRQLEMILMFESA